MQIAFIGQYYKTLEAAKEAYLEMPEWKQRHNSIVEFNNAYLIISNEQIKAFKRQQYEN